MSTDIDTRYYKNFFHQKSWQKNGPKNPLFANLFTDIAKILPRFAKKGPRLEDPKQEFRCQLRQAIIAVERALAVLEEPNGPQKSFLYRVFLKRALDILTGLYHLD